MASSPSSPSSLSLFKPTLAVISVGLRSFANNIVAAGGECVALDWSPPAQGDREAGWALARTLHHPVVEAANAVAMSRFLQAQPVLSGIATARDVLPGMAQGRRLIVHAGPPIAWPAMCGPMRGAVLGCCGLVTMLLLIRFRRCAEARSQTVPAGDANLVGVTGAGRVRD